MPHPMSPARQFPVGDRCTVCSKPLSRYNPYEVCGPCRVELAASVGSVESNERGSSDQDLMGWERFKRRPQVTAQEPTE